jgi:hypothetical protein
MLLLGERREAVGQQKASGRSPVGSLTVVNSRNDSTLPGSPVRTRAVSYEFEFSEPSGNKYLDPKETGRLRIVLTNNSKSTVRNVVVRIIPLAVPSEVSYNDSIIVGDIPVNATRYAIFYFAASERVRSQILTFQVDVRDSNGLAADARLFTFSTRDRRM